MLTSVSCYGGAYNFSSIWFIRFGSGSWQEVDFPRPVRGATETGGELINAGFDPASGLLESFNKGRGYGDCGTNAVWGWDGERFVLVEWRAMAECRGVGPEHWPVLYRTARP